MYSGTTTFELLARRACPNIGFISRMPEACADPILTVGGLELAAVMGGAVVTETIFGLDGIGRMAISAALDGDFPVVIGTTIFAGRRLHRHKSRR